MVVCVCRNCRKNYDPKKSRADWKGYCSMKCQHEKAHKLGARDIKDEYRVLKSANEIGEVYV